MSDADIIDRAGGPTALAELLKLQHKGAVQRISNWRRRGIPARVRLEYRAVFDQLEAAGSSAEKSRIAA